MMSHQFYALKNYNININMISENVEVSFENISKPNVEIIGADKKYYNLSITNKELKVSATRHFFNFKKNRADVIIVQIPTDYSINDCKINTASGKINVKSIGATTLCLKSVSGLIDARKIIAVNALIKSVSGSIKLEYLEANTIALEGISGKIQIKEISGEAKIKTVSGNITIDKCLDTDLLTVSAISAAISINGTKIMKR